MLVQKVDQFLSKSVTHVIVKSLPSPSKNRPEPKHSRESPKNPFLDNTGVTDLVRKAEALNMKVWTEESECGDRRNGSQADFVQNSAVSSASWFLNNSPQRILSTPFLKMRNSMGPVNAISLRLDPTTFTSSQDLSTS